MNKYNRAMAHVSVSEEAKERILNSIRSEEPQKAKVVRFPNAKRYIALAACFAVVLIGVLAATVGSRPVQPGGDLQTGGAPVEYRSAKALSKASGIKIEDLQNLPFEATEAVYTDYQANIAEIAYSDGAQSLYYRVSEGNLDNSGDYNEYETVETAEIRGVTVTLKGSGGLWYCVLYEKGGRSYSIGSTAGLTLQQIENMLS